MINSQQACDWLVACADDPSVERIEQYVGQTIHGDKAYCVAVIDKKGKELAIGTGQTLGGAFTDCALKFRTPRGLK